MQDGKLLTAKNISVNFSLRNQHIEAVKNISFHINKGEVLGVVGESGSGKSVTALSLMNLIAKPGKISSGEILFHSVKQNKEVNFLSLPDNDMCSFRGNDIAMIFQEPMTSLNPVITCGKQITEAIMLHKKVSFAKAKTETLQLFEKVKLPDAQNIFYAFPHILSGGQKQRVMIAMAISCNPALLIADEPTTALDVTIQKSIISLLKELQQETGMSILFISHDLGVISQIASRIIVMRNGEIVEENTTENIFKNPQHGYTKGLIACKPPLDKKLTALPVINDFLSPVIKSDTQKIISNEEQDKKLKYLMTTSPLVQTESLSVTFYRKNGLFRKTGDGVNAVKDVSLKIFNGETLGIAGESGSGKTTLAKTILNLITPTAGKIFFNSNQTSGLEEKDFRVLRKQMQIVFQDPYSSLNPKIKIGKAIEEVLLHHKLVTGKKELEIAAIDLLQKVGLTVEYYHRYPHELSGGQRQRICIARALAVKPAFLVCDECVSALDVSVQAQILNLLNSIKREMNLTLLFISHDLSVLKFMCDRIIVMKNGSIEEEAPAWQLFENPKSEYTKKLLEAVPVVAF